MLPSEGELGAIVGVEDDIVVDEDQSALANPEDCKGVSGRNKNCAFAPAIRDAHGVYKGEVKIDYDLFENINSFSPLPVGTAWRYRSEYRYL